MAAPGRPRRETPRKAVVVRFEPHVLASLDAWNGDVGRHAKIMRLICTGLAIAQGTLSASEAIVAFAPIPPPPDSLC